MSADLRAKYPLIPELVFAALMRHRDHSQSWPHGHFVNAVLENNLMEAYGRADLLSLQAIPSIVMFLANEMPGGAYGSPKRVASWISSARVPAEAE